jgi:ATP-dependent RNA helicase RhlE
LVCIDEKAYLRDIEKLVGIRIPSEEKEGFEPDPNIKPEPVKKKGNNRNKGNFNRSGNNSGRSGGRSRNQRR